MIQFWSVVLKSPDGRSWWGTGVPRHHGGHPCRPLAHGHHPGAEQQSRSCRHAADDRSELFQSGRYFVYRAESAGSMPIPYQAPDASPKNPDWGKIVGRG
jgi:hypothetical protein